MNAELQKQLDELKAERESEREQLSKQRKELEASLEARRRERDIVQMLFERPDYTRVDCEKSLDEWRKHRGSSTVPDYIRQDF